MSDKEIEEIMDDEDENISRAKYIHTVHYIADRIIGGSLFYGPNYNESYTNPANINIKFKNAVIMIEDYILVEEYQPIPFDIDRSLLFNLKEKDIDTRRKFLVEVAAEVMSISDRAHIPIKRVLSLVHERDSSISFNFTFKERKEG